MDLNPQSRQHLLVSKVKIVFLVFTCTILFILYNTLNTVSYNIPKSNLKRFNHRLKLAWKAGQPHTPSLELQQLSNQMQQILQTFEENHNCSVPAVKCGNYYTCGFGCQIHHRIVCLMIAYTLNRTLLHNYIYKWPYTQKWPEVFQHLTTRCKTRPNTLIVNLETNPPEITEYGSGNRVNFPLENGITVPFEMNEILKKVHTWPFLWWVGQFATYAMKLIPEQEEIISETKKKMGFQSPVVGIHVRRTDKINEKQNLSVFHELDEYMEVAESYYYSLEPKPPQPWRVFVASEDTKVIEELKTKYLIPKWNIISVSPKVTTVNWRERNEYLYEIVRDVTLLSHCDFVICGFSSNVCRLVYELMQSRDTNAEDKVVSLDFKYAYIYSNHKLNKTVLHV